MNEEIYEVSADSPALDFFADGAASVIQNVRTIMKTQFGTVPLYRSFGVDWGFVDRPVNRIPPMVRAMIREQIERFEPRARVESVSFEQDAADPGRIKPKVRLTIIGV